MRYMVVVEEGPASFGAYTTNLLGCIAVGESAEEVVQLIRRPSSFILRVLKKKVSRSRYRILQAYLLRFKPDVFSKFPST